MSDPRTDPQGDRCPHIPAASAATYPLRCSAPQWARFDNRQKRPAYQPLPSLLSAAAAQEVQAIPRTDNVPRRTNSARSAPPILHDPQRAKGSLDRRSKWFSLVPFFLQKKKGTRAGARNAPSRARRQCPPNTTAASAATYPLRCSAPQWARFDNRHSTSAPTPTLTAVSGSGARDTSDPPNRQRPPPSQFREISTAKFALARPAPRDP